MTTVRISRYSLPQQWLRYHASAIVGLLVDAKTAAGVLSQLPYLSRWIEQVHEEQLRLEAVGTSRIEGAEFTQREQDEAFVPDAPASSGLTHSQRQLRAADTTYRWLREVPASRPVTAELVQNIHRRIVTGCDDDHCTPGALRLAGANVTFGSSRCRGAEGGYRSRRRIRRSRPSLHWGIPEARPHHPSPSCPLPHRRHAPFRRRQRPHGTRTGGVHATGGRSQ